MLGIKIMVSGGTHVITVAGSHVGVDTVDYSQLCGPVGLYLARRKYRYMLADWAENAWSWPCGTQDYNGERLDAARDEVVRLGGNPKLDRRMVREA